MRKINVPIDFSIITNTINRKKVKVFAIISIIFSLAGCGIEASPITSETSGVFNHYLVYPFSWLLLKTAELFNNNYGLSIIAVTLFIRFMLLPLLIKHSNIMFAMRDIQPKLTALKEKYSTKDQKTQLKLQEEMVKLFQR